MDYSESAILHDIKCIGAWSLWVHTVTLYTWGPVMYGLVCFWAKSFSKSILKEKRSIVQSRILLFGRFQQLKSIQIILGCSYIYLLLYWILRFWYKNRTWKHTEIQYHVTKRNKNRCKETMMIFHDHDAE